MVKLGGRNLVRALCTVFAVVALTTYVLNKRLEASELVDSTIPDVEEQHVEAIDVSRYGKAVGKAADPRNQLDMFGTVPENNSTYYRPPKNGRMLSLTNKGHKPCPGGASLVPAYNGMALWVLSACRVQRGTRLRRSHPCFGEAGLIVAKHWLAVRVLARRPHHDQHRE
jgi:hypothetical protein